MLQPHIKSSPERARRREIPLESNEVNAFFNSAPYCPFYKAAPMIASGANCP